MLVHITGYLEVIQSTIYHVRSTYYNARNDDHTQPLIVLILRLAVHASFTAPLPATYSHPGVLKYTAVQHQEAYTKGALSLNTEVDGVLEQVFGEVQVL